jgi:rubrerythrin
MSPEEICLQRADKTRSKAEHQRLILVAQKHRLNQEEFAKENGIDQRRNNELRSLRSGLKEQKRIIAETISAKRSTKKVWRCSRCGDLLSVKRCLACELEIARG